MKRRTFLGATGTAAAAASTFPAPAVAQGVRELKFVVSFPKSERFELFGRFVTEASAGRLKVSTYYPGELVGSFEVFDAVSEGVADMYWSAEYYWLDRSPAYSFFATVPFGLIPVETYAWIQNGGGQELWDELSDKFNIKPLILGTGGIQMGGWFLKELTSIGGLKGLRYRIPGLGGEVLKRLSAVVVNLPPGDIVPALKSGALDGAEWVGPEDDFSIGLHTAAKYYYYPGFHEPGLITALGVNKKLWESLSGDEQSLIETAAAAHFTALRSDLLYLQSIYLAKLVNEHGVQLRKFDDEILSAFGETSGEVIAELGASDRFTQRVYDSYMKFLRVCREWTDISHRAYLDARARHFPYR